jgi:hypothetical protein
MSIIVKEPERKFTPAPEGLHAAVCIDVIEHLQQETPWGVKDRVEIRWEIEEINPDTHAPFQVRAWYTASLNEKAKLRAMLETWRGRKFTPQELKGFDVEKLVGAPCQLQVVHNPGDDGRVFANVQAVIKASKHTPVLRPSADYVRVRDQAKAQSATQGVEPELAESDDDIPF